MHQNLQTILSAELRTESCPGFACDVNLFILEDPKLRLMLTLASRLKHRCFLIYAFVVYGAPSRHPVISVLCNSHSFHCPDPPNCFRCVWELGIDSCRFYAYMHIHACPCRLILTSCAPTSADASASFSSDHRLCVDLRVALATKNKDESEQVKAKQSKISIMKPLQSFALSSQGVEAAILLPGGSVQQCQQFSTK